jgi:hypothetical protein
VWIAKVRGLPPEFWVDEIHRDQTERWAYGNQVFLEEYLRHFPELTRDEEDLLVLIGGEIRVRRSITPHVSLAEYQNRFPQLKSQLSLQFQLDRLWTD